MPNQNTIIQEGHSECSHPFLTCHFHPFILGFVLEMTKNMVYDGMEINCEEKYMDDFG